MENPDTFSRALPYSEASSTFEDHDNGFTEPIPLGRNTNSFHKRSGGSRSIVPPPRRPRTNDVRRINEKHQSQSYP